MNTLAIEGNTYYIGTDSEFAGEIKKFFCGRSANIICREALYEPGILINLCSRQPIDVIFIDFSVPGMEMQKLLQETLYLKRVSQFKPILLVALFKDEFQKDQSNIIFSSGFQLCHIKGTESEQIFRDSFYIGMRKKIEFPVLALARNINLDLEIGICSTITAMDKTEFLIETDLEGLQERVKLELRMFPELKCESFEIKESHQTSYQYPMTNSYTIAYPIAGPWTNDSAENIQQETIDTWIDHSEDEFIHDSKTFVRIYSNELRLLNELFKQVDVTTQINFGNEINNLEIEILVSRPSLIFFELDTEETEAGQISLSMLDFLFSVSMGHDYKPIIVVTNCSSSGHALQKAYNYPLIVATSSKLDAKLCLTLIEKLRAKRQKKSEITLLDFKPSSEYRSIDVLENFTITSLTEHEVTFYSEQELPMFTVLHFKLPIEFHATIVPPIFQIEKKNNKQHYMAFIHGLTEEQLKVFRKFLNQIIFAPMKDFSESSVKKSMGDALINDQVETIKPAVVIEIKKEPKAPKPIDVKKYFVTGKSKL